MHISIPLGLAVVRLARQTSMTKNFSKKDLETLVKGIDAAATVAKVVKDFADSPAGKEAREKFNSAFSGGFPQWGHTSSSKERKGQLVFAPTKKGRPLNIVAVSESHYRIEIDVAGFDQDKISVHEEEGRLVVDGMISKDGRDYVVLGMAHQEFNEEFRIAENVKVEEASFRGGMLIINCKRETPEKKGRPVNIKRD
jgi:HSP20 family molecular chaperone IbpA